MLIYKYRTVERALKILQRGTIKASGVSEFNDPFEVSPRIDPKSFTPKKIELMLVSPEIKNRFYTLEGHGEPLESWSQRYFQTLPSRIEHYQSNSQRAVAELKTSFPAIFDMDFRLFCASKRKDSILMWSHYADEHRGCIIGFESDGAPFSTEGWVFDVKYDAERAEFEHDPERKPEMEKQKFIAVAARKYTEWSYEEEVRVMFPADDNAEVTIFLVPPTTIRTIVFGCNCTLRDRNLLTEVLNDSRYAHVEISAARKSEDCFALEFDAIRGTASK